jgi:hypothetical protein
VSHFWCAAIVLAAALLAPAPARAGAIAESAAGLRAALASPHLPRQLGTFRQSTFASRLASKTTKARPYGIKIRLSHLQRAVRRAVRFGPSARAQHSTPVTQLPTFFLGFDDRPIPSTPFVSRPLYLPGPERIPSSDRSGRRSSRAPPV